MGKIIAIANQKGGVGKTTTAINLGASIAVAEKKVLVIDMDPQGNATTGLGFDKKKEEFSILEVLTGKATWQDAIKRTDIKFLFLIPSNRNMLKAELELASLEKGEVLLREKLKEIKDQFDFIFLDCPPSLGFLTLNSMIAADSVLIPLQSEYYALEGLSDLLKLFQKAKARYNPKLEIEGILITMFDERTVLSKEVAMEARKFFPDKVFKTIIPRNVRLSEAPSYGKPALLYDIKSKGAQAYLELAKEMLTK